MFVIIFTIILALVVYYFHQKNKPPEGLENIPFVSSLPITWALIRQRPTDELRETMTENSKGHDVYMTRFGWIKSVTISSPEYARDLLMAHEDDAPKVHYPTGSLSKFFGLGIPFSNGERWRTYRKLSSPVFQSLSTEIVGETVFELFDLMQQNLDEMNIFEMMQRTTIEAVGKLLFGHQFGCLKSNEIPRIISVYRFLMELVESLPRILFPWIAKLPTETNRKFATGVKELDEFFYDMIEKKKKEMENHKNNNDWVDILTSVLKLGEENGIPFNAREVRDELAGYIVAGETTTMALCTSFYHLAKHPEMQEKARQEVIKILGDKLTFPTSEQLKKLKYVKAVIKESLRTYPPATAIVPRKLTNPMKIGPYLIPANTLCKVDIWQVNHHPNFWKNPNQYDPERFLNREKRHPSSWIPFSLGPRNCVGQNFSLMEQKVILSMFLLGYKWTLPENSIHKDKLILESHVIPRPLNLRISFTKRK